MREDQEIEYKQDPLTGSTDEETKKDYGIGLREVLVQVQRVVRGIRRGADRSQAAQRTLSWLEGKEAGPVMTSTATFIVISGGSGGNSICSAFDDVCYVLPVSDDGGSSSEIIRVLGGPSIGA